MSLRSLSIATILLAAAPGWAGSQRVSAEKDATINGYTDGATINYQDYTNGAQPFLLTGSNSSLHPIRSLIKFTMPSSPYLVGRTTVTQVIMTMRTLIHPTTIVANQTPQSANVYLYRLLLDWTEGGSPAAGTSASTGLTPCSGGATWNHPNCTGTTWSGGSYGGNSGYRNSPAAANVDVQWNSAVNGSTGFATDVQGWMDGTLANYGWMMYASGSEGSGVRSIQRYSSRTGPNPPYLDIYYNCKAGFEAHPSDSNLCTSCTATVSANQCHTGSAGNSCNDALEQNTNYSCTCNNAAWTNGPLVGGRVTTCVDRDGCVGNPCDDGGNASATCNNLMAPTPGYTCNCTAGFASNGTTCVGLCSRLASDPIPMPPSASDPCGNGGYCTLGNPGQWSCTCPVGYASTGGTNASCQNLNACDSAAQAACADGQSGNACNDDAPPSTSYTCTCGNAAYVVGSVGGKPACVNKNECAPDHCDDGGDVSAACTDQPAPGTGYACTCSSALFKIGTIGAFESCVDRDECAEGNPCGNGVCTNIPNGGGYDCVCDPGYVLSGPSNTATCVHPDGCNAKAALSCVTSQPGNVCVDDAPPKIGYTCDCSNPAYTHSVDQRSCVDKNACAVDHCIDEGDAQASCVDRNPPKAGYDCDCSPGFVFNGTSCVDVNECVGGANPCGKGSCGNTKGGYLCACPTGSKSTGGEHPTCKETNSTYVGVTTEAGLCRVGPEDDQHALRSLLLLLGALLLARVGGRRRSVAGRL